MAESGNGNIQLDLNPAGVNDQSTPGSINILPAVQNGPETPTPPIGPKEIPNQATPKLIPKPLIVSPTRTVPMFSPTGELGDVPAERVHDAIAAGGVIGTPVLAPDGTHGMVPANRLHEALKAGGKIDDTGWVQSDLNAHPTVEQRLERAVSGPGTIGEDVKMAWQNANPKNPDLNAPYQPSGELPIGQMTPGGVHEEASKPLVQPGNAMTPEEREAHPYLATGADFAGSMSSPENLAIMVGSGGLGKLPGPAGEIIGKALSGGFGIMAIHQAMQESPKFLEALANGDEAGAKVALMKVVLNSALAEQTGEHVTGLEPHLPGGQQINAAATQGAQALAGAAGNAANAVGAAGQAVGNAVGNAAGNVVSGVKAGLGLGDDFFTTVKKISPPSKGYASEYNQALKTAEPQLREVFKANPTVSTPQQMYDAIDQHIQQTEARVGAVAQRFNNDPRADMTGIQSKIVTDLNKAFDEVPGQYKPAEREAAIKAVLNHVMQEEPGLNPNEMTMREPTLAEIEGVRQRFNQDTKPSFGSNAPAVPAAEAFAKKAAANSIREAVDSKFDTLGVKDIKEWRKQESGLIDVRDQIQDAVKKSDEMGTYNVFESLTKQLGWKTLLGIAAGAAGGPETAITGAVAASGLGAVADYVRDLKLNPNRKVMKAAEMANKSTEPTGAALPSGTNTSPQNAGPTSVGNTGLGTRQTLPTGTAEAETETAKPTEERPTAPAQYMHPDTLPHLATMIPFDERPAGSFSHTVHEHEWGGHLANLAMEGFHGDSIISNSHPEAGPQTSAAVQMDWGKGENPIEDRDGKMTVNSVASNIHRMAAVIMGGAAQDELNGISFDDNKGIDADKGTMTRLAKAVGFTPEQTRELMRVGIERAKKNLTQPGMQDIIRQNAAKREADLHPDYHASPARTAGFMAEVKRLHEQNGNQVGGNEGNGPANGRETGEVGRGNDTGGEGSNPGGVGQSLEANRGLVERSTGDPKVDEMIKDAGGIPAGTTLGMPMFHDPVTGTSLVLKPEQITPENIAQHLADSRKTFGVEPKANLQTSKSEDEGTDFNFGHNEKESPNLNEYHERKGLAPVEQIKTPVNKTEGARIADAYDAMKHSPNDPKVKASYDALKKETSDQWKELQKQGMTMSVVDKDPYSNAAEMLRDIKENHHISVWSGEGDMPKDHPMRQVDPETGTTYNNVFRAVHDVLGHGVGDNDFSEQGEENAYNLHKQSYSQKAIPALATETKGQANWFFNNKGVRESGAEPNSFPTQKAALLPNEFYKPEEAPGWAKTAADMAKKQGGGFTIDYRTGKPEDKGYMIEAYPEKRVTLNHDATPKDIQNFYNQNRAIFRQHPDLRVGGFKNELNISAHTNDLDAAKMLGRRLDQQSVWDVKKAEKVPTGGKGGRIDFQNYPFHERMTDLRGESETGPKDFEHLSKDIYDHLEPDEREYLKGDKTLQRNVMTQYRRIQPSVTETTNAMQAGAALGGWWKRYIDVFHNLAGGDAEQVANTIGPSHAEVLKQWHAAVSGNKNVQDANNLAWHSYADWLDAGKPTDRKSINEIVKQNAAQPAGSGKKGNAAISDTLDKKGKVVSPGLDTEKLFRLINSPEMRGERPFTGDVFSDEQRRNPLMGSTEGARKIPSMGATVAGKGNLNRLVIDAHIRDFYGHPGGGGPAAQYIADSAHLRQAAEALGLKGGEGQEQLWGTVLGLKTLLKEGLTNEQASGKLNSDTINKIGKDYADIIANDPEISQPGGLLDRLKDKYGIGRGSAGVGEAHRSARESGASQTGPAGGQTAVDQAQLAKTAERIRQGISPSRIKTAAPEAPAARTAEQRLQLDRERNARRREALASAGEKALGGE